MPSGNGNLISAGTPFSATDREAFIRSGTTVKAFFNRQPGNRRAFDLSNTGLTADDSFVFKGTLNVKSHYDQWSGLAFIVRGQLGGKCYVVSFQKEAVYILDSDLSNNTSSVMHVNTEFTNVNKPFTKTTKTIPLKSPPPPTSSPFISTANPSSEMRSWQKSGPPCWLSRAGVRNPS